jgi:hypothetical protein
LTNVARADDVRVANGCSTEIHEFVTTARTNGTRRGPWRRNEQFRATNHPLEKISTEHEVPVQLSTE